MVRIRSPLNLNTFLGKADKGMTILSPPKKRVIFSQGDTTDAVFYI